MMSSGPTVAIVGAEGKMVHLWFGVGLLLPDLLWQAADLRQQKRQAAALDHLALDQQLDLDPPDCPARIHECNKI